MNRLDGSFDNSHNKDFEHCVCPIGFVGLTCEFRLDICPGGTHACMHGAECMPRSNHETHRLEYSCNCDRADENDLRYAGKYCQFEATEYCTVDRARPLDGTGAFCVNGGKCKDFVAQGLPHPGCACENDFQGENCEIPPSMEEVPVIQSKSAKGGMAISLTMGCTLLVLLIIFLIVYRRQKKREKAFRPSGASYYKDNDADDMLSTSDIFIGNESDSPTKAPTIADIGLMIDAAGEVSCRDLVALDDTSTGLAPSTIYSDPYTIGTNGSNNSAFSEEQQTGRAMLMKEANDTGSL